MRWLSRLVTVAVIVGMVALGLTLIRAKMPETEIGQSFRVWAEFRDASRLAVGSPVVIAGVRVGEIEKLTVEGELARGDLRLVSTCRSPIPIPAESWITKRAESAFGDSYLEIVPTGSDEPGRGLKCGDQITHVIEGSSTDTVLRSISRAMPKVDRALETVHDFALDGRKWSNGTLERRIVSMDRWIAEGNLDRPIEAADRGTERFERGAERAADAVAGARPEIAHQLDRVASALATATGKMRDAQTSVHDALTDARARMDRVDPTVHDLAEVMREIDEGHGSGYRGTLGKLVNDPTFANDVEEVTEDLESASYNLNRLKSWLGAKFEYDWFSQTPRVYASAEIRARNDKFYLVEFEKGPLGSVPKDQLTDSAGNIDFTRAQQIDDGLRFTAQFGKTLGGWFQIRGGLKDSTFGIGSDVLLNGGKLRFSADAFGAFTKTPRLKVAGAVAVFRSIYLLGGVDDALNAPGYLQVIAGNTPVPERFTQLRYGRDWFLGAALHFDDADLATLLRVYGALIVSAL
jgi:phospholipid/cholesterol/gamma-HCH transport system substrate-binding protein